MKNSLGTVVLLGITYGVLGKSGAGQRAPAAPPMCPMSSLSLGLDGENGQFDGMSHSGTLVVLRNVGQAACRVPAVPQISFTDGKTMLPVKMVMEGFSRPAMVPRMGHGPVVLPVVVAAGAEATASLRWVSGDVFEPGVSVSPTALVLTIGGETQQVAFTAQMWGELKQGVQLQMTRFTVDPVWTGR